MIKRQRVISTKDNCLFCIRTASSEKKKDLGENFFEEVSKVLKLIDFQS